MDTHACERRDVEARQPPLVVEVLGKGPAELVAAAAHEVDGSGALEPVFLDDLGDMVDQNGLRHNAGEGLLERLVVLVEIEQLRCLLVAPN